MHCDEGDGVRWGGRQGIMWGEKEGRGKKLSRQSNR